MIARFLLVLFCCVVTVLPARAQGTAAATTKPAPATAPDWKTLYAQSNSAARQWEERSRYLEASCQSLRENMDADTATQTAAEAGEALPPETAAAAALPPGDPADKVKRARGKAAPDYQKLFGLADARGKAWRARAQRLESRRDAWTAKIAAADEARTRAIAAAATVSPGATSSGASYPPTSPPTSHVPTATRANNSAKTIHVRDYTRQDGTHVQSYNRQPSGR